MIEVASVGPKGASRTDLPGSLLLMAPGASGAASRFIDRARRGAAIAVRFAVEALLDAAITDKTK